MANDELTDEKAAELVKKDAALVGRPGGRPTIRPNMNFLRRQMADIASQNRRLQQEEEARKERLSQRYGRFLGAADKALTETWAQSPEPEQQQTHHQRRYERVHHSHHGRYNDADYDRRDARGRRERHGHRSARHGRSRSRSPDDRRHRGGRAELFRERSRSPRGHRRRSREHRERREGGGERQGGRGGGGGVVAREEREWDRGKVVGRDGELDVQFKAAWAQK